MHCKDRFLQFSNTDYRTFTCIFDRSLPQSVPGILQKNIFDMRNCVPDTLNNTSLAELILWTTPTIKAQLSAKYYSNYFLFFSPSLAFFILQLDSFLATSCTSFATSCTSLTLLKFFTPGMDRWEFTSLLH